MINYEIIYKNYLKKKNKIRKLKFNGCGTILIGISFIILVGIIFLVVLV